MASIFVASIQVPAGIYRQSTENISSYEENVKTAVKDHLSHKRLYVIGPTLKSEESRCRRIVKFLEEQQPPPPAPLSVFLSLCPRSVGGKTIQGDYVTVNPDNLHVGFQNVHYSGSNGGRAIIRATCGGMSCEFETLLCSWPTPTSDT